MFVEQPLALPGSAKYLEGHQNCITGSRVTAIYLNGWILPISGASVMEGVQLTGQSCPVYPLALFFFFWLQGLLLQDRNFVTSSNASNILNMPPGRTVV